MNSALVRKDAVMLHDPLRTHTRATMVGAILAAIGLLGFLVFGILKPKPKPPDEGIVIAKESGQIYVKTADPEMLIPTFNLASARLILMGNSAQGEGDTGAQGEGAQVVEAEVVPDDRLEGIRKGRKQGIPDAPPLPSEDQRISDNWAVCHHLPLDDTLEEGPRLAQAEKEQETDIIAGVSDLGKPLSKGEAILVKLKNGEQQLIYRPEENANTKSEIVRAPVPGNPSVIEALRLAEHQPRPTSLGLLNSVERVEPLEPPAIEGLGDQTQWNLGGEVGVASVGDVFSVENPGGIDYYVVLDDGKQRVTQAVATMIRHEHTGDTTIPAVKPELLDTVPNTQNKLAVQDFPEQIPEVLDPLVHPTACMGWTVKDGDFRTAMYTGTQVPYPKKEDGTRAKPIKIGQANEVGIAIDSFYMPTGRAAVVHAATSKYSFKSGPIQLVSDSGMRYGVPDKTTADHLGLTKRRPAPESIIELLPTGSSLNTQDASRTFDSVKVQPGSGDYEGQNTDADEGPGE